MHDLTGSHLLPILAVNANAAPRSMPRLQHRSAPGANVTEQLGALKALQQEGAQAFSDSQVSPGLTRTTSAVSKVFWSPGSDAFL